jgi:hypothetical protein
MNSSGILVRQATEPDWPQMEAIEQARWKGQGVEVLSRTTFDLWMSTHPEGFLVGVNSDGSICSHAYFECLQFSPDNLHEPGWDKIFTRPYDQPHHDHHGNATLILNAVTVPGTSGGLVVVNRIMELAAEWKKEWFTTIPRMPGLLAYCNSVNPSELSARDIASFYAVRSMSLVGAQVSPKIADRVKNMNLPDPTEPDQVVARFAGRKLEVALFDIVSSGYQDPPSMNLAALCIKRL